MHARTHVLPILLFDKKENKVCGRIAALSLYGYKIEGIIVDHFHTNGTSNVVNIVTNITPIIFSDRPARIILAIVTYPVAKTMVFGGVLTGIMKEKLVTIVTGTMS